MRLYKYNKNLEKGLLRLYKDMAFLDKRHIEIRFKRCPYFEMDDYINTEGLILDIGCGHGLFSNFLALSSENRNVIGIDISPRKISVAKSTIKDRQNINFFIKDVDSIKEDKIKTVTIIDVLYLVPFDQQEYIIKRCFEKLDNGGVLLIKETPKSSGWRFKKAYYQEVVMVKLLKRTMGSQFYYRSKDDWKNLLLNTGFNVTKKELKTANPSVLFIAEKS